MVSVRHKCLLRITFITIWKYATYFFNVCFFFSKHVHISVLCLCLFVRPCVVFGDFFCIFFTQSCSHLTGRVFYKL